jgi:hypothetical protein
MDWMLTAVTCVTSGFDSCSMRELVSGVSLSRNAASFPEAQAPEPDHNVHDGAQTKL